MQIEELKGIRKVLEGQQAAMEEQSELLRTQALETTLLKVIETQRDWLSRARDHQNKSIPPMHIIRDRLNSERDSPVEMKRRIVGGELETTLRPCIANTIAFFQIMGKLSVENADIFYDMFRGLHDEADIRVFEMYHEIINAGHSVCSQDTIQEFKTFEEMEKRGWFKYS